MSDYKPQRLFACASGLYVNRLPGHARAWPTALFCLALCVGCAATKSPSTTLPLTTPNKPATASPQVAKPTKTPVASVSHSKPAKPPASVAPLPPEKQDEVVRQFEERRDAAQLGAAIDRWKQGKSAESEAMLVQLLERNPEHVEGRRALADLYADRPDAPAAIKHFSHLVEHHPEDAQAHHSLGLVYQSNGRRSDALAHFEQAARLEPKNELFTLSLASCHEE